MNKINIPAWLASNIYCTAILLYIYLSARRSKMSVSRDLKAYGYLVWLVIFSFIADSFSRLFIYDNFRYSWHWLIVLGTYAKYLLAPLVVPIFYKYYTYQIKDRLPKSINIITYTLIVTQILYTGTLITTYFTGWIFYFDQNLIYHRGQYYLIAVAVLTFMAIIAQLSIVKYKSLLSRNHYTVFSLFLFVPIIGMILQAIFYGLALGQMCISFSVLIIYVTVISHDVNKDHLTSLNDRRIFDRFLDDFIIDTAGHPFAALMIDLDDFKDINDEFGHFIGDDALKSAANLISRSVRNNDIVCRYGGDEFMVLLHKCNQRSLDNLIVRIDDELNDFNTNGDKLYDLKFSMGGAVYDAKKYLSADEFIKTVDENMYINKKINKAKIKAENKEDSKSKAIINGKFIDGYNDNK